MAGMLPAAEKVFFNNHISNLYRMTFFLTLQSEQKWKNSTLKNVCTVYTSGCTITPKGQNQCFF